MADEKYAPYIKELVIDGFLPHSATRIVFDTAGVTYITGENGRGKTSIIDAICFCLTGKDSLNNTFEISRIDPAVKAGSAYIGLKFSDNSIIERTFSHSGQTRTYVSPSGQKTNFPSQAQLETAVPWIKAFNKYVFVPELALNMPPKQLQKLFLSLLPDNNSAGIIADLMRAEGHELYDHDPLTEKEVLAYRKSIKDSTDRHTISAQYLKGALEVLEHTEFKYTMDDVIEADAQLIANQQMQAEWDKYRQSVNLYNQWENKKNSFGMLESPDLPRIQALESRISKGKEVVKKTNDSLHELIRLETKIQSELDKLSEPDKYNKEIIQLNAEIIHNTQLLKEQHFSSSRQCRVCRQHISKDHLTAVQNELSNLEQLKSYTLLEVSKYIDEYSNQLSDVQLKLAEQRSIQDKQTALLLELEQERSRLVIEHKRYLQQKAQIDSLGPAPTVLPEPEYIEPGPEKITKLRLEAAAVQRQLDEQIRKREEVDKLRKEYDNNYNELSLLDAEFTRSESLLKCVRLLPSLLLKREIDSIGDIDGNLILKFNSTVEGDDADVMELYFKDPHGREVPIHRLSRGLRVRASLALQLLFRDLTANSRKESSTLGYDWLPIVVDNVDAVTWKIKFPVNSIVLISEHITELKVEHAPS